MQRRSSQRIKINSCIPRQWPCEEAWWPWLRGDPELLSLMTSAEQAAGRAALVVLIKSENGQNTSNAQSVGSQPGLHTRYKSQVWDTTACAGFCPFCGDFRQENSSTWLKGEDQQPDPFTELWLNLEMHCWDEIMTIPRPRRENPTQLPSRTGHFNHASALPQPRAVTTVAFPLQTLLS